jgi:hypothetical protein
MHVFKFYDARSSERDLLPLEQYCSNIAVYDVQWNHKKLFSNCLFVSILPFILIEPSKRLHVQQPHRKIVSQFTYVGLEAFLNIADFISLCIESMLENINRVQEAGPLRFLALLE